MLAGALALALGSAQAADPGRGLSVELAVFRVIPAKGQDAERLEAVSGAQPGDVLEYQASYQNRQGADQARPVRQVQAILPIPAVAAIFVPGSAWPAGAEASSDGKRFEAMPLKRWVIRPDGSRVQMDVPVAQYRALRWNLGDLAPGQSKPLAVTFKANQRGKVCNTATANSSNAGKVSDDACTVVLVPGLKVEKTGTKEQILGRNADYEIVVSNTGDTTLKNVTVSDTAPAETSIVTAPGATIAGNKATWTIASLAPGAKATQSVKLTSKTAGTHCNNVTASTGGLSDSAKACTLWKGIAAVLLEVVDDPDPIQVGENTTYTIKVTNQGFADIHNMKIAATFADQVTPVSSAQGSVSGKSVSFPVVAKLGAKQVVTYTITVKGVSVGDSRNKIVLTSDELKTPVDEEESTTVY